MQTFQKSRALRTSVACLFAATIAAGSTLGQVQVQVKEQAKKADGHKPAADINKAFKNPDVDEFTKRFETDSREVYGKRKEVVKAIGLKPGDAIADVGAGTGFYSKLFAEAVGSDGKVYAVDIAKPFLKHIADDAKKLGLTQIQTIEGSQHSTNLPADSVDTVFMSDVYHHFEHHQEVLASIHRALHSGGTLALVEFDKKKEGGSEFMKNHIRATKDEFISEIKQAGFEPIETKKPPAFKENFFARFKKIDARAAGSSKAKP